MKDKTTALLLSIFLGGWGIDRFYLGYAGMGVLKLLTGGCFGILYIIDIINIATGKLQPAGGHGYSDNSGNQQYKSATVPATDPYEDMKKLSELKNRGVLTEEEFSKLKAECLSRIL